MGKPYPPLSRQRNHQVVNQPGSHEHQQPGRRHANAFVKRTEDEIVSQLAKSKIPALAPELAQCLRQNRLRHDRLGVNADRLPEQCDQMEAAEMQQKDQTEKADPSPQQTVFFRDASRNDPQQRDSESRLQSRPKPLPSRGLGGMLTCVEKSFRIHPRPRHQISDRTPRAVRDSRARLPPCHPFQAGKNGKRQRPHEPPRRHTSLQNERQCREDKNRQCLNPDTTPSRGSRWRGDSD